MGKTRSKKRSAIYKNDIAYQFYIKQLSAIAASIFRWNNIPKNIDMIYSENRLLHNNLVFFYDEDMEKYLLLPYTSRGGITDNHEPSKLTAYCTMEYTQYRKNLFHDEVVFLYDRSDRASTYFNVRYYAQRLWSMDRSIDSNISIQKFPYIAQMSEEQKMTFLNFMGQIEDFHDLVITDKRLNLDSVQLLNLNPPYVADKIAIQRSNIYNEFLTSIGVENVTFNKKERVVSAEIEQQAQGDKANKNIRLNTRLKFCEDVNIKFGLRTSVDFINQYSNIKDKLLEKELKEGESNGVL